MALRGAKKHQAWPIMVMAFFSLSALANNTITGEVVTHEQVTPEGAADDDSPGFIRNNTWSGSFDRAGDATREAELELKSGLTIECEEDKFRVDNPTQELLNQRMTDCLRAQQEAQNYAKDAEGIRKMQRTFAHVSRASDVAAVGAIGFVGYSELIKKDSSQASSLEGVAKIQETAGYVSYATGAADISMGAYALAVQKRKLEKMKKTLSGISKSGVKLSSADSALVSKISNAAEKTKKAAVSHMAYGAGKVAVGYASMYLADRNRKIADSLTTLETAPLPTNTVAGAPYVYQGANGAAYYQNNDPEISIPTGPATGDSGNASPGDSFSGAGGGASIMPSSEFRQPASLAGKGGGLGGLGSAGGAKGGGTGAPEATPEVPLEASAKPAESTDGALNLSGGGGSRYGGGGSASSEEGAPVSGVVDSLDAKSSGTGVNPNSIYADAMVGLEGEAQGSTAGVSGSGQTLFQVVKVKYNKMMEVGRLQGPGAVEVRN